MQPAPWREPHCIFVFGREGGIPSVIPKICALCEQQRTEKPISMYWAWTDDRNRRTAYKQLICADCFRSEYAQFIVKAEEPVLMCPECGILTVDDYQAVYLTYCIPGVPKSQSELPMCPAHSDSLRATASTGAVRLEDREVGVGGLGPQPTIPSANQTLESLGLRAPQGGG